MHSHPHHIAQRETHQLYLISCISYTLHIGRIFQVENMFYSQHIEFDLPSCDTSPNATSSTTVMSVVMSTPWTILTAGRAGC